MLDTRPRNIGEEVFHKALVERLRWEHADKRCLWWHTPNGGPRSKGAAGKLKAMGVLPGVPDLQFMFPDGHVAFLELKRPNGVMSEAQYDFESRCRRYGVEYAVAYSMDQAVEILTAWGVLKPARGIGSE